MWSTRLILASASPRRVELLRGVGLAFEVVPSGVEETGPRDDPRAFALSAAKLKGLAIASRLSAGHDAAILSADTIVVVDGEIFEKPRDAADAEDMLSRLSGRAHEVLTAFCFVRPPGDVVLEDVVRTEVRFRKLTTREIRGYVKTGEPMDKAGAYAAQGIGMFLIESVKGSYSNVVGLPVCEVVRAIEKLRIARLFPGEPEVPS